MAASVLMACVVPLDQWPHTVNIVTIALFDDLLQSAIAAIMFALWLIYQRAAPVSYSSLAVQCDGFTGTILLKYIPVNKR